MSSNNTSERLREVLLDELIKRIEDGESTVSKDGEVVKVSAPASTLTAAIAYLKQFPPGSLPKAEELSDTLKGLAGRMPFPRSNVRQ